MRVDFNVEQLLKKYDNEMRLKSIPKSLIFQFNFRIAISNLITMKLKFRIKMSEITLL